MSSKVASWFAALLLSILGPLFAAEATVFFVLADKPRNTGGLFRADASRGHALTPGFSGEVFTNYGYRVEINSRGYRDGEWLQGPSIRAMVLGDSFTFGEPLPVEQGFVAKASARFDASVRFYNLGVSGYGPAQELATLVRECPELQPTHVFYMYYVNDTAWDNVRADATTVVDGFVVHARHPDGITPIALDEIQKKVAQSLERRQFQIGDFLALAHLRAFTVPRIEALMGIGRKDARQSVGPDHSPANTALAADLIAAMAAASQACGSGFTMVVLPSRWEAMQGIVEPATEDLLANLGARAGGIDVVDLRKAVAIGTDLGMPKDNHYNAEANAWVANHLARALTERHPDSASRLRR